MRELRVHAGVVVLLVAIGCGGGASSSASGPPANQPGVLAPGPHTLALALTLPGDLVTPVSGLVITLALPPGVAVATSSQEAGRVAAASLVAGSAVPGASVVAGSYSASRRQVKVALAMTPAGAWSGEALRLGFTVEPGAVVKEADLLAGNAAPLAYKVVGVDATSHGSVDLTSQVRPTLSLRP